MTGDLPDIKDIYRRSFIIGSGFFTVALIEPMYSAYIPLMLADHLQSSVKVGAVLSALNLIAPLVIPIFAALSDRTSTRIGKRMPYIIAFLPPAALALAFVPVAAQLHLSWLVGALVVMNFLRHAARGPVVSLMPDLVPPNQRSQANGVINTMGGLAAITATVALAPLITVQVLIPGVGLTRRVLPFWIIAGLIIASTVFLFMNVREALAGPTPRAHTTPSLRSALSGIARSGPGGAVPILAAVLLWFLGWKLITPFITLYARDYLGAGEAAAGLSFGMLAISQTLFAVPSGIIAARLGRRRVISAALGVLTAVGAAMFANHQLAAFSSAAGLYPFWALLFVMGLAWVVLITNCLPMLWDLGGLGTVGLYTGLYYFASQTALVVGPGIGGAVIEYIGYGGLFVGFAAVMLGARMLIKDRPTA